MTKGKTISLGEVLLLVCTICVLISAYGAVTAALNDDLWKLLLNIFSAIVSSVGVYLSRIAIMLEHIDG